MTIIRKKKEVLVVSKVVSVDEMFPKSLKKIIIDNLPMKIRIQKDWLS